jgi:tight adherence protein C
VSLVLLLAIALAFGLVRVWRLAMPARTNLSVEVSRWDLARARASQSTPAGSGGSPLNRAAARIVEEATRRGVDLSRWSRDLSICDTTAEEQLSKALAFGLFGLLAPVVLVEALGQAALSIPVTYGLLAGAIFAVAIVVGIGRDLRLGANRRREEFRRTLSSYLDLVAMAMEAGRGYAEALPVAADIGTNWAFVALQDAIGGARASGITVWRAMGRLGERYGIPELVELENALDLTAGDGARIKSTLVARAETLRAKRVADAEAHANQSTESMRFTLLVMVFAFFAYELYPPISRLFGS